MSAAETRKLKIIVLGALSAIGEATARTFAAERASLLLAGRDNDRLSQVARDLQARGAEKVVPWPVDLAAVDDKASEIERMVAALGGTVDAVLLFYGVLGDQREAESNANELRKLISVNFASAAEWCVASGGVLERQKSGVLLVIGSVAGDRGRQSNYIYGSAKAGLAVLVEGLAHRLAPIGARAVVVKLGFVDTPMTAHLNKTGPLWAKPAEVARILKRIVERPSAPVVYVPWFWRPIMTIVRNVPTALFHRTKL